MEIIELRKYTTKIEISLDHFYSILETEKGSVVLKTSNNFTILKHWEEKFEKIYWLKKFPNLFTESNLQMQDGQSTTDRINIKKTIVGPSVQLLKSRCKETNIKNS